MKNIFLTLLLFAFTFVFANNNDCKNNLSGKVVNKQTGAPITKAFIQLKLNGQIVEEKYADDKGGFNFSLKCDQRYQVSAIFENYSKGIKLVFTSKIETNSDLTIEMIPLNEFKIEKDQKMIVMEQIEFEPDDFSISKEAALQLDAVVEIMNKYNYMNLEIAFHTNNMGDLNFLKNLSQKRADACANYIIQKGVSSSRIKAVGYGFEKPIDDCKKESMQTNKERCTKNNRTEFIVISENL